MRATLSQSFERAAWGRNKASTPANRWGAFLGLVAGIGLLAFTTACDSTTNAPEATSRAAETAATAERVRDFEWPVDPDHPVLELDVTGIRDETGHVARGSIRIELMPELAPETVARILDLAEANYYDGTTFHRVIPGFMIQGGDPNSRDRDPSNDGRGRSDGPVPDEFGDVPFVRGVVGIGHKGREGTAGNQFFIMHGDDHSLDGRYTAIGRVVSGMDLVDDITRVEVDRTGRWGPKDRPIENVVITHVSHSGTVGEMAGGALAAMDSKDD